MIIFVTSITILLSYFVYKGYKNTHSVAINQIEIEKDAQQNDGDPLRILHISDMHLENISITPEQLYEHIKMQPIDLIALTGDFLDRKRSIPKLVPYLQALNQLKPAYGAYAVFGNHDYVLRQPYFNQMKEMLNEHGFKTLQNENETIEIGGKQLNMIGIDDFSTKRSNLFKSYEGVERGYNLVITHDPNVVLVMSDYHFDYLLSGHFHGGQIHWPKPYHLVKMGKLVRMNMVKGLHQYLGRPFYISEGLGQTGVNIRVGSRPEITIHHLYLHQVKTGKIDVSARAG
ncbi:metallophosphoesterase [Bacillus sp. FJAT-50079]|uniref:metallophosphoesterase n=1 Tax=Bacillus sp. FJAT-50079 TaxID=2833577 RepID=UPI001BCA17F7|nr:metallophosphoesterase [Bacillus sp. FJAT-50079]MBS4209950.1 metallophosphoesterase [Bacillus sp. FJAT-50079]